MLLWVHEGLTVFYASSKRCAFIHSYAIFTIGVILITDHRHREPLAPSREQVRGQWNGQYSIQAPTDLAKRALTLQCSLYVQSWYTMFDEALIIIQWNWVTDWPKVNFERVLYILDCSSNVDEKLRFTKWYNGIVRHQKETSRHEMISFKLTTRHSCQWSCQQYCQ